MIKSMTGYGKGIAELSTGRLTLEIRTLNGKNCDINIKSSLLPKDKELEVRKTLTDALQRGTVDLLLTFEPKAGAAARKIDAAMVEDYFRQIHAIGCKVGIAMPKEEYLEAILRFPDVFEGGKQETIPEEEWPAVQAALQDALTALDAFRVREGAALYADVTSRVAGILALYDEVEAHEAERLDAVRERIQKAAAELQVKLDKERFEQEMIFYLEKLDINEEKVRLRQGDGPRDQHHRIQGQPRRHPAARGPDEGRAREDPRAVDEYPLIPVSGSGRSGRGLCRTGCFRHSQ